MKYKFTTFSIHGLNQTPKDFDFQITPSLVFSKADPDEIGDLGFAYAIGIKWGYVAFGFKLFGAKIAKQ